MTDKDQEILNLYLKNLRRKKIIIGFILIIIVTISCVYIRMYMMTNNEDIMVNENTTQDNTVNENNDIIKSENIIENSVESIEQSVIEELVETEEENIEIGKSEEIKQENDSSSDNKQEEITNSTKPNNKDFLFTDGYTMENVTQAAQDYLTSSGYAGECIPIQDTDGVYLGMRVIFY